MKIEYTSAQAQALGRYASAMAPDNPSVFSERHDDILGLMCGHPTASATPTVARLRGDECHHPGGPGSDPGPGIGVVTPKCIPHAPFDGKHQPANLSVESISRSIDVQDAKLSPSPVSSTATEEVFALLYRLEADPKALKSIMDANPIHMSLETEDSHYDPSDTPPAYQAVTPIYDHAAARSDHLTTNIRRSGNPATVLEDESYFRRRYEEGRERGAKWKKLYKERGLEASNEWLAANQWLLPSDWLLSWKSWLYQLSGGYTPVITFEDSAAQPRHISIPMVSAS
ncbi:hypothetical protein CALCODRAFT_485408 [Calocera cornea HHB12733]|uniref:Uncharacterized protein n=1 Tax=Calocera cornea HHB12733 TaxID=1353952 RepID=A0A165EE26_9BASI|nr:hypothetical protein CALCODRAFT_488950 [Calocera cornea HHB12733]KZT54105.1 hypothetical protein CALCODRAFT_485789 [Calocera cornea HHB12733]KZT54664.1 hypothetical protein CALCODRAFT_485408 [Calocera cornea HHB12733]